MLSSLKHKWKAVIIALVFVLIMSVFIYTAYLMAGLLDKVSQVGVKTLVTEIWEGTEKNEDSK